MVQLNYCFTHKEKDYHISAKLFSVESNIAMLGDIIEDMIVN